jgi:hypothetical protein
MRIPYISLAAISALALGGCAYGYGDNGYGYGDNGYGYGDYGYGYNSPYYGAYGYGYGAPYYGWYGDSYYPGVGFTVYDSYRRPRRWNDRERNYWSGRQRMVTRSGTRTMAVRPNWSGFNRRSRTH